MRWILVADDLTGACDSGAVFASAGLRTRVFLRSPDWERVPTDLDVAVVSTESRPLPVDEAVRAVEKVLRGAPSEARIYKKIDSTLRGHPAEEFFAVLETVEAISGVVCPAFPGQGRIVVNGQVLVNGERLEETHFGKEVPSGDIRALFSAQAVCLDMIRRDAQSLAARLAVPGVFAADAETDEDLQRLAEAGLTAGLRVFCGSAGLARGLAVRGEETRNFETLAHQGGGPFPAFVIVGSRNPVTRRQVEKLVIAGGSVVALGLSELRIANSENGATQVLDQPVEELCQILRNGRSAVLVANPALQPDPLRVAERLAQVTARVLAEVTPAGLVLSGGDTAAAVCRELGCTAIDLGGEVMPGLAWGRLVDGACTGMAVVTKAGGFGAPDGLVKAVEFLTGH
jgi:uncharacterized protein YgbK (DUF1537 family)